MRELADLMNDALAERSGSLADLPTAQVGDRLHRKVRFRRARRHTLEAGGATAAVAVLGATTWFGMNRSDDPAPAVSPTVSATPSPTSSPTPSPEPSPTQTAVADDILGLPPTYAMPAGLLEQTTPGWVLSIYRSEAYVEDVETVPDVHSVVLSSPEGTLYRVVDLPIDPSTTVTLDRWDAGSSTAVVSVRPLYSSTAVTTGRAVLDLTTGAITEDLRGMARNVVYVGQDAAGAEVWAQPTPPSVDYTDDVDLLTVDGDSDARFVATLDRAGQSHLLLDPTGTRVAFASLPLNGEVPPSLGIVDLATGEARVHDYGAGDQRCDVVGWVDASTLLTTCSEDDDLGDEYVGLWNVDITSSSFTATHLRDLGPTDEAPQVWSDSWLADGLLAAPGYASYLAEACPDGLYTWTAGVPTLVTTFPDELYAHATSVDGRLYLTAMSSCHDATPESLTAYPASGPVVLAPEPAPRPDGLDWTYGMTSWVAAR
ncbi:hypothetical protein [Cellulomonas sp. P5_C5]